MKAKKRISILLAFVLAIMALTGCGSSGNDSDGASGKPPEQTNISGPSKIINIALNENLVQLDPHDQSNLPGYIVWTTCMEALILDDRMGNYEPLLAESWEHDSEGLVWTFKLRKGIKFHNGEDFNAADVQCTFDRLLSRRNELQCSIEHWTLLEKCETIDDYTVQFTFSEPNSMALMAFSSTPIIPDEAYAEHGDDLFHKQLMYGTGPWIFQEWQDGQFTHFIKNEEYWDKANYDSYYDELYIRHLTELSTAIAAHLAGDIQVNLKTGGIDEDLLSLYEGTESRINMINVESGMYNYIGLQCSEDSVFHDIDVRRAFEYCVDREAILNEILGGAGKVPVSIINDTCVGFDASMPPYTYDPEQAKELLANSSYDGRKLTIVSNTSTKKAEETLLAISENMNAVGFNTDILITEPSTMLDMRRSGNYDLFYVGNMHNGGDPCQVLNLRILNDAHKSHYVNDELNALIEKIKVEMDTTKRNDYIKQCQWIMREEAGPHSAIVQLNLIEPFDHGVTGIDLFRDGNFRIKYVTYDPALVP
ncbi:ABC transporter substrate-binding protein [Ruthenibacterium lactatiformans]|uniref:Solute-binding protein family 5 domain-containing protein n=1 Tax=Ruthenibacterium lactatiformans TaxID=1550024 RepID=A0A6L6LUB2_9FIRM|nr:ABC transporter substrate-binding protein [Ruthenibacterium lactatiformans]MTQ81414.1 hypothetical protein [Ruthenibacterium lactatiformans]MTS28432.1 hypothetical protein [Ruthenibacterium lactatiformans]MTS32117.1 hypothetical protein [Ruthenibacterium lactatiformans]MTS38590.1 hypothetical protein [Ruthenibacterium lactatiformans]MTS42951.1 hypothetical protein [Ruthenibacterium lactatiformans]